jgi:phosphatidate cytidylyltransferase
MKTRIISGAVFVVIVAIVFFLTPAIVTAIVVALMSVLASYELLYTTGLVKNLRLNVYSAVMAVLVTMVSQYAAYSIFFFIILLYWMLLFSEVLLSSGKIPVADIGYCLMSGLIIPLLLSALVRIRGGQNSNTVMFIPFIMAFFSDTGAYFIGVFFGNHKMCPNISPKKSWEGFVGGIVVAMLGMVVYCMIVDNLFGYSVNYVIAVIYGLVGSIGSVVGDLTMSVIKRQAGIKDYGKLIPGHGGILDRFDSVIITAPLTEALMILIPMVV